MAFRAKLSGLMNETFLNPQAPNLRGSLKALRRCTSRWQKGMEGDYPTEAEKWTRQHRLNTRGTPNFKNPSQHPYKSLQLRRSPHPTPLYRPRKTPFNPVRPQISPLPLKCTQRPLASGREASSPLLASHSSPTALNPKPTGPKP